MFKVKLDKELRTSAKEKRDAVEEVKLLMDSSSTEDMRILRGLGMQSNILRAEKKVGKLKDIERLEGAYGEDIFSEKQIKQLAIKYKLRFLKASYFKGDIDVQAIAKIKAFAQETKAEINEWTLRSNFFVLAPEEMFNLEDEKIEYTPKNVDPVLFYALPSGHYKMIHKWGADFSVKRLFLGWKWEKGWNFFFASYAKNLLIVIGFFSLIWGYELLAHPITFLSLLAFLSIALNCLRVFPFKLDDKCQWEKRWFTEGTWKSTSKYS